MGVVFNRVALAIGASDEQIKLIFCLLVSYPLGSVFIRIPSAVPAYRHCFNILISIFYLGIILNLWTGILQLLLDIIVTYAVSANFRSPWMPWIVFAFIMGHLTINQAIRTFTEMGYDTVDITGPQMVLTMKLTAFAWNVHDGRRPTNDLDKWQTAKRIVSFPSFLEILGYSFYFPGILVGPYLDFVSYRALISESLYAAVEVKGSTRRIPKGRKRVAYMKLLYGLCYLVLFVAGIGNFNYNVATEKWFLSKALWFRILYFQICGFFERSKYYAVWILTEGASILTGFGFSGYGSRGESLWKDAANVDVLLIELPTNFKVLLDSWNMTTNVWLRECVYKRVTPKGNKPGFRSSMITFLTSAFWHGIYGGYYLTFVFGGFVQTVGRLCRKNLRPLLVSTNEPGLPSTLKRIYDIIGTISCILLLNFTCAPFILLTVSASVQGWRSLGLYGFWMIGLSMMFFYGGGRKLLQNMQRQNAAEGVPAMSFAKGAPGAQTPGPQTPRPPTIPPLDIALDEVEKKLN